MFKDNIGQASQGRGIEPYSFQPKRSVEVGEEDVVRLLAHRAPGEEYKSIHPPLEEMKEPECAVREMVEPIEGAKAGNLFAPKTSRQRAGIEPGILAGRAIVEGRGRDIEKITKELVDSKTFDIARTGLRGRTVHGQRGILFDALRRWAPVEETEEYEPEREISAVVGPHSYLSEEAKRRGAFHVAQTIIGGYPSEEPERSQVVIYRGAKGAVVEADPYFSAAMRARRSVKDPYLEKAKETLLGGVMHRLVSKFKQTGKIEPDEMLELLKSKKYAVEKKKEDWLEEIEKIEKEEDSRHMNNILDLTSKFKHTGELKPEEFLSLLESKKYAQEIKEDWGVESVEITEIEKEYYEDMLPIPEELKRSLLKQPPLPMEKAKKMLIKFAKMVDESGLNERVKRSFIQTLEVLMTPR